MDDIDQRRAAIQKLQLVRHFANQDKEPCAVLPGLYIGNGACSPVVLSSENILAEVSPGLRVHSLTPRRCFLPCRTYRRGTKLGFIAKTRHNARTKRFPGYPLLPQATVPIQKGACLR